jgi:hypothetical protein
LYWITVSIGRALLLQHDLLMARREVRLAAGRERLPVHEVGGRARRRLRDGGRSRGGAEDDGDGGGGEHDAGHASLLVGWL